MTPAPRRRRVWLMCSKDRTCRTPLRRFDASACNRRLTVADIAFVVDQLTDFGDRSLRPNMKDTRRVSVSRRRARHPARCIFPTVRASPHHFAGRSQSVSDIRSSVGRSTQFGPHDDNPPPAGVDSSTFDFQSRSRICCGAVGNAPRTFNLHASLTIPALRGIKWLMLHREASRRRYVRTVSGLSY